MTELGNKTYLIPGAASGMGRAIALMLAAEGANLAIADVDSDNLAATENELAEKGAQVVASVCDITQEDQVAALFDVAKQRFGKVDVLLNVPGLSIVGPIAEMSADAYDKVIDVNVKGTFLCSKHFLQQVDGATGGVVVNFASMAAKRANPNAPVYCTAKAAVAMFSQGFALQAKEKNVRVTTLCPGPTNTNFWGDRPVPREKFLAVDDVVAAIRFVLSLPEHVVVHEISLESFEFFKK